jgi:hypothetical protein
MDLMARLLLHFPWGPLAISSMISIATGVAIIGFGAPPKLLVYVTYATVGILCPLSIWAERKLGRR